jgi:O-antigen/teichoic acid export membrane protein
VPAAAVVPAEAGPVRNTVLQLASQLGGAVFTATLTLYLVRALDAGGYGVYALAISISGLVLYPAGLGLPWSIGRFLADHRKDPHEVRAIFRAGLRLQIPAAALAAVALFAAAGAVADAYGHPGLAWPLRWAAVAVLGQAVFAYLVSATASLRRVSVSLKMSILESAMETGTAIALVAAGSAAAGAVLGRAVGYAVASVAGLYLFARLLGPRHRGGTTSKRVSTAMITRYAGAMFVVDLTWTAIAQLDVLLIGAVLTATAVGSFSAVARLLLVLGYLGTAVAAGVAPRLSLGGGAPDTQTFETALRYLIIAQGVVIAPLVVWAQPIVSLLLGPGYHDAAEIMQVMALYYFISAPAALITVSVTYLGEARRRVVIMVATLVLGLLLTYVLLRALGVIGAAVADDVIEIGYVAGHLWICGTLISFDRRRLTWTCLRTAAAAAAMGLTLLAFGTNNLSPAQWIVGLCLAAGVYAAMLLATRELSIGEIRSLPAALWTGVRR